MCLTITLRSLFSYVIRNAILSLVSLTVYKKIANNENTIQLNTNIENEIKHRALMKTAVSET